jgi:hypothetical protein
MVLTSAVPWAIWHKPCRRWAEKTMPLQLSTSSDDGLTALHDIWAVPGVPPGADCRRNARWRSRGRSLMPLRRLAGPRCSRMGCKAIWPSIRKIGVSVLPVRNWPCLPPSRRSGTAMPAVRHSACLPRHGLQEPRGRSARRACRPSRSLRGGIQLRMTGATSRPGRAHAGEDTNRLEDRDDADVS